MINELDDDDFGTYGSQPRSEFDFTVYSVLPEDTRRELCLKLLDEFGASVVRETTNGELMHRCVLPLGGHSDHTSVTAGINYKKLTFGCFVCQNQGGFLWWISTMRQSSSEEAVKWLSEQSGIATDGSMDIELLLSVIDAYFQPKRAFAEPMPRFDERVLRPWSYEHWGMFHPYLTEERGIPEATLHEHKVGYCDLDEDWRYYQRIIIPLFWDDKLVGWQARKLSPEDPEPAKYKNSPGVPRDRILYGLPTGRRAVVVESPASKLRHHHHQPLTATLGAMVTDAQCKILQRYERVIWWPDNDKAGWTTMSGTKNMPGVIERLSPYVDLRVVDSPYYEDPAELPDEVVDELVAQALPWSIWDKPATLKSYRKEVNA